MQPANDEKDAEPKPPEQAVNAQQPRTGPPGVYFSADASAHKSVTGGLSPRLSMEVKGRIVLQAPKKPEKPVKPPCTIL